MDILHENKSTKFKEKIAIELQKLKRKKKERKKERKKGRKKERKKVELQKFVFHNVRFERLQGVYVVEVGRLAL